MEEEQKQQLLALIEPIKNSPEYLQPMNLMILCKSDPEYGPRFEKVARILAEYGVPVEKVVPCMMDLTLFMMNDM